MTEPVVERPGENRILAAVDVALGSILGNRLTMRIEQRAAFGAMRFHWRSIRVSRAAALRASPLPRSIRPLPSVVTYHDPGVLVRGIVDAPRRLLAQIPGLELREHAMSRIEALGEWSATGYPDSEVAKTIATRRLEELGAAGASLIMSTSPCSVAMLRSVSGPIPVTDPTQPADDLTRAPAEPADSHHDD